MQGFKFKGWVSGLGFRASGFQGVGFVRVFGPGSRTGRGFGFTG